MSHCVCFTRLLSVGLPTQLTIPQINRQLTRFKWRIARLQPQNSRRLLEGLYQAAAFCSWSISGMKDVQPNCDHECFDFSIYIEQLNSLISLDHLEAEIFQSSISSHQQTGSQAYIDAVEMNRFNENLENLSPYMANIALIERGLRNPEIASHVQDGDLSMSISAIIGHRYSNNKLKFRVLWKNSLVETEEDIHSAIKAVRLMRDYVQSLPVRSKNIMIEKYPELLVLMRDIRLK